ncbi:MAG: class I SAM-dependent DNA methyltransferase [Micropepsaceae bacterium]
MQQEIIAYYDRLAPNYDASRFANSYGRFIDARERALLRAWLPASATSILELGCGTGRLSGFATIATDASTASLAIARTRERATRFAAADAERLPLPPAMFDAVYAFHLLMHLETGAIHNIFTEAARVLRPGGVLIADIASKTRRDIAGKHRAGEHAWHGATALTSREFEAAGRAAGLDLRRMTGLLFLPVHRLPERARPPLAHVDSWLAGRWPSLSSYLIASFAKP